MTLLDSKQFFKTEAQNIIKAKNDIQNTIQIYQNKITDSNIKLYDKIKYSKEIAILSNRFNTLNIIHRDIVVLHQQETILSDYYKSIKLDYTKFSLDQGE